MGASQPVLTLNCWKPTLGRVGYKNTCITKYFDQAILAALHITQFNKAAVLTL